MNGPLDLRIITQPYSEVYWGYFRSLVFGNSLTKHNKLNSFSYSLVNLFLPLSHIPPCYRTKPPNFPRLFEPRHIPLYHDGWPWLSTSWKSNHKYNQWACSFYDSRMPSKKIRRRILMYKSSGQKQKYILTLTLTWVLPKSMCFHTATYRSFLSFCDRDGRQRSIPSGPFWQIEWRENNLLFLKVFRVVIEYAHCDIKAHHHRETVNNKLFFPGLSS